MKKIVVGFALALASVLAGSAQVTAEVVLEQEHFLIGETLPVAVKITNRSGQTLRLGNEADWLTFALESKDGHVVTKIQEVPVPGEFLLESGKVATRRVNLEPYFELNRIGHFKILATVNIKAWDSQVVAKTATFDVVNGAEIWSQKFGMPNVAGDAQQPPRVRKYSLEQANYLRSQLRLYLRLTDVDAARTIKVFPIGNMVSISDPEHQVDRLNRLHVLYQTGARGYLYTVISSDGEITVRQMHEITGNRPRLQADDKGGFFVSGGSRRLTPNDLPALANLETDAPLEKP